MSPKNSGRISQLMGIVDPDGEFGHTVMTRKRDESLVVSCAETGKVFAVISINEVRGASTKTGSHAPLNVSVDRESVYLERTVNRLSKKLPEASEGVSAEANKTIKGIIAWLNKFKPQQ